METRLIRWLRERGLTQVELARVLGLDQASVSRMLRGNRSMRMSEARTILAWASERMDRSVPWDELFGADDVEAEEKSA
jgi:transcriptional regulator with XRE-family HTH domain